jgi:uncharacterized protein YidB (DUF937 family)
MSFFEQMLGGAVGGGARRSPGLGSTVAAGVVLALLVKAVRASQAHQQQGAEPRSFGPGGDPQAGEGSGQGGGGLLGNLGGLGGLLSGGGGIAQVLGGLGGAGALGSLVDRFRQAGLGQQANSWISGSPNQPVAPHDVAQALGDDAVGELQQKTGMPRDQLLQELAHLLPQAVNEATPQGRIPSDAELHQIAQPPAG